MSGQNMHADQNARDGQNRPDKAPPGLSLDIDYAVEGFELSVHQEIAACGITVIFGPSGSGKTTLLELIAGFLRPSSGTIGFCGHIWFDKDRRAFMPPYKRPAGFLFQDARLFDHLSVRGNLQYADKRSKTHKDENGLRAEQTFTLDDIIEATDIAPLLMRRPDSLSGGERRRAALARTLLTRPRLLLFDEPLTGLDMTRKKELLPLLESLPRRFGIPCLYVSHDVNEVSRLADHVMILDGGKVAAFGPAERTLLSYGLISNDLEGARSPYEKTSLLTGRVRSIKKGELAPDGLMSVQLGKEDIAHYSIAHYSDAADKPQDNMWLPLKQGVDIGQPIALSICARDVALALTRPQNISIQNILSAKVRAVRPRPDSAFCDVDLDIFGQSLTARITRQSAQSLELRPDLKLFALIKSASFQR